MAKTIHVDIVSAEGEIFSGAAEMVFVPAKDGRDRHRAAPRAAADAAEGRRGARADAEAKSSSSSCRGGALEIQPNR
jgi:F-type H+-transporting ATPase subunit epsilon